MPDQESLRKIAEAAVTCEQATGCPAELQAAQCALESGWLKHAPGNNPFGIKAARRHQKSQIQLTTEYVQGEQQRVPASFAVFDSLADAFEDHARLITTSGAYRRAWSQYQTDRDLQSLVKNISPIYATDPDYAEKILAFVQRKDLGDALAEARAALQKDRASTA